MILVQFFKKIEVLDILCRISIADSIAYHLIKLYGINYLDVGTLLFLLSISRNYVVSVRRGFFFLLVLGQVVLFYFGPPWAFAIIKLLKVHNLGTC